MRHVPFNANEVKTGVLQGKIVTVDQLTYHDPQGLMTPANVIPMINTIDPQGMTTHANFVPTINTMVDNM